MILFKNKEIVLQGLVEIRLELEHPKLYLESYIEVVSAKKKTKRFAITLRPNAVRTRLIRIPKNTIELRLIPLRYSGEEIKVKKKQLIKFILPINLWIINGRLTHHKRDFRLPLSKLWRSYNQTFDIRMGIKNYAEWIKSKEPYLIEKALPKKRSPVKINLFIFPSPNNRDTGSCTKVPDHQNVEVHYLSQQTDRSASAVKRAIGSKERELFLFLYETDRLNKDAIDLINIADSKHRSPDLIYTDEDLIKNEERCSPSFKPDWNPELWDESQYTGRAVIFSSKLLKNKNIDWQSFLPTPDTISDLININKPHTLKIVHIPYICMHLTNLSTPLKLPSLPIPKNSNFLQKSPSVELLIPTRDQVDVLKVCIDSIRTKTNYKNFQITILDNDSTESETLNYLSQIGTADRVKVLKYPHPFNYSAINNFGASKSDADILVLVNNDIEVISANWLEEMVSIASKEDVGCVGAKLYYPNGWIQHAGVVLGIGDIAGHSHRFYPRESLGYMGRLIYRQQVTAVTAACLAVKRSIWNEINGLDEKNLTVAYNDVDFCLRVQEQGYRNIWTPYAELIHHESISRGADDTAKKKKRYQSEVAYMKKRWKKELEQDPFYHPAFSRTKEDFSLQF